METPVTPGNRYSVFHIVVEGDVNKSIGPTFSEILAFSVFINMFFSLLRSVIAANLLLISAVMRRCQLATTSNLLQPVVTVAFLTGL